MPSAAPGDTVLILTPIKDAVRHIDSYFAALGGLTYPADRISLGMMEGDSEDDSFAQFAARLDALRPHYASANIWRKDFGFRIPFGLPRWQHAFQIPRRSVLAKARNHLLFHALNDQDWVLWLDVDVAEYPPDLIERLLASGRDIVHPHCVIRPGGPTFDRNGWREQGRVLMEDLRDGPDLVRLDSVGGTVLLVRADLHRDGLVFPPFPYGAANQAVRQQHPLGLKGELETEGFGIMALDMGHQCWGMPKLEVLHAHDAPASQAEPKCWQHDLQLLSCMFELRTTAPDVRDRMGVLSTRAQQHVPILWRETLRVDWTGEAYRISGGGVADDFEFDMMVLLQSLYRRAQDRALSNLRDHGFITAACGWQGTEQFLITGGSGAGKSPLTVRLMLAGFDMASDAWVLMRDGQATAWPRAFQISHDAIALLPQLNQSERFRAVAAAPRHGWREAVDPLEFGKPWHIATSPVCAFFDIEPNFGARTRVRPCGKVEMVRRVMAQTLPPSVQQAQWLAGLTAAIDRADTFILQLGELDSAVDAIREALAP